MSYLPFAKRLGLDAVRGSAGEVGWAERALVGLGSFAAVGATAATNGAYFLTSWGWPAIVFGWAASLLVVLRRSLRLGGLELGCLAALWGLIGWTALSAVWSDSVTQTVLQAERGLVLATGLTAFLLATRRRDVAVLLAGVLAGIVVVASYALATKLFPERLATPDDIAQNRLQQPIGYWNALGTFTAVGALLALGVAARARSLPARAAAGASLPILVTTLYFTFGRGGWIALAAGLVAALAIDVRRLQLVTAALVLAPASAVAVWLASRQDALTARAPALADASHAGHRFVPIVVVLCLAAGGCAAVLAAIERGLPPLPRARLVYESALWSLVAVGAVALVVAYGSPWAMARRAYDDFRTPPAPASSPSRSQDLNQRLFMLWGSGRSELWRVAWRDARAHPVLGSGAGTYQQHWLRDRPVALTVIDAHSLYLETLAELGPLGLALLVAALGLPLAAAVRARRHRFVGAAAGAYAAYLVHAAADWDWEVTAVTLTALLVGGVLLVSARDGGCVLPGTLLRPLVAGLCVAAAAFAFVGLVGNRAVADSAHALAADDAAAAEAHAREAIRWAPWSSQGDEALGEAQLQSGRLAAARESFRAALAKDPRDWTLWFDMASASTGDRRRAAALVAYRLNPLSPELESVRRVFRLPPKGE